MSINEAVLREDEKIIFSLRELYSAYGYQPYRMSKFEEYDLYAKNKDYLISDNVITFTDTNGKLLALKPDVTLSIIKNIKDDPSLKTRVFYNENVYRVSKGTNSFKEIMQAGLEFFGAVDTDGVSEVIKLAALSLKRLSANCVINISELSILEAAVNAYGLSESINSQIYKLISEKNMHELEKLMTENGVDQEGVGKLKKLISCSGCIKESAPMIKNILDEDFSFSDELVKLNQRFYGVLDALASFEEADMINIDLSLVGDINYYNGIILNGFVEGVPGAVLSGGQYDNLMKRMRKKSGAMGFAVYLDAFERFETEETSERKEADCEYVNVALPKGRLGDKVYEMMAEAGFECPSILEPGRKLIFENADKKVRYFWVKPSDVAIYVERGAADIGICGKDILLEYEPAVYELLDMKTGKCRMCVAAPKVFKDDVNKTLIVATKFSNIAAGYYQSKGRDIDIIHLNGSIEIAPILELSDVIVDIVETGNTLRENDLEVFEEITDISARLIANQSAYEFKNDIIKNIVASLAKIVEEK